MTDYLDKCLYYILFEEITQFQSCPQGLIYEVFFSKSLIFINSSLNSSVYLLTASDRYPCNGNSIIIWSRKPDQFIKVTRSSRHVGSVFHIHTYLSIVHVSIHGCFFYSNTDRPDLEMKFDTLKA